MKKSTIVRAVALFVCLAIIGLSVPGLLAADKRAPQVEARQFFLKPWLMLTSILPSLIPIFDRTPEPVINPSDSSGAGAFVRPTGDIRTGKPSGEE